VYQTVPLALSTAQTVPLLREVAGESLHFWELDPVSRDAYVDVQLNSLDNDVIRMRFRDAVKERFERLYLTWAAQAFDVGLVVGLDHCFDMDSGAIADMLAEADDGSYELISIPDPGVGVQNIGYVVPAGRRFEPISFHFIFTCAAVAANRDVRLLFCRNNDAGDDDTFFVSLANHTQTSGQAARYCYAAGASVCGEFSTSTSQILSQFPTGMILNPGNAIRTGVTNFNAGDAFSVILMLVRNR